MYARTACLVATAALLASSLASAQTPGCEVKRQDFVNGGASTATMQVAQGGNCELRFRFGGANAPDSWELARPPTSGKVTFRDDVASYQPNDGFAGQDNFTFAVFGKAPNCSKTCTRNGQYEVTVTVTPKS